jgi:chromosome partitioning protein
LEGVDGYDVALIDCQPSVGELVTNALVAADYALIVTKAEIDSLMGIENMLEIIAVIKRHYNANLTLAGIVVNDVDQRSGEQQFRVSELHRNYAGLVWEPHLPHRTRIADAKGSSTPIHDYGYRAKEVSTIFDALTARLLALVHPA